MLTMEEQQKLKKILELLNEEKEGRTSSIDVSGRLRDEKGRFRRKPKPLAGESKYGSDREIKLIKMKGSYGTYLVQTKLFSDGEMELLYFAGILFLLAWIF